ncbi:MAG: FAD-dependent oxidoreductase [Anaerolineae bacterium]|jgi:pyruvate/2-oxoglutarate dehydrogenase complex dihydrolipoamide dehydrogenase (E3) component
MVEQYDLLIVGAGPAGLAAAMYAARIGRRVALVEKDRIGGDCTWSLCIPFRTLIKAARVAHQIRVAGQYGITVDQTRPVTVPASAGATISSPDDADDASASVTANLQAVFGRMRAVVADIAFREESPSALRRQGIQLYLGRARFVNPYTIRVGDVELAGRRILLTTGARPFVPSIPGLRQVRHYTYQTLWDMPALPKHLLVLGAGPTGCEMAQAFRRLGAEVTLVEARERLLSHDEPDAAALIADVLAAEGVDVRLNHSVRRVWQDGETIHLASDDDEIAGDALLVTTGRVPQITGLGLEVAGVEYGRNGIQVDRYLRTTRPHILAAGDCTGGYHLIHYAAWQGLTAARNALLPWATQGHTDVVPWTTFTDPEVAHVGLTEAQAREIYGDRISTTTWPISRIDRALAEGDTTGFVKLVYRRGRIRSGRLLGVTIVAGSAGEMIHEWVLALQGHIKLSQLIRSMHVYPTYTQGNVEIADSVLSERLIAGQIDRMAGRLDHMAARLAHLLR